MPLTEHSELVSEYVLRRWTGKPFVMVEGVTDRALWAEYADCEPIPTQGKDLIIDALNSYMLKDAKGIAGIIDLDYTLISQSYERDMPNLLFDDCCPDMESLLLGSDALRKVIRHSIDADDIQQLHDFADKLKIKAQRLAAEFGYFRLLNHLNDDYGLRCNSIRFHEVIDSGTLELDRDLVASRLAGDQAGITSVDLLRQVDELRKQHPPGNIQLCRGKDVIEIMATIMPILFETEFGEDLSQVAIAAFRPKGLSKDLRMAYEYGYFRETSLYNCIRKWESDNRPFRIVKQYDIERTRDA